MKHLPRLILSIGVSVAVIMLILHLLGTGLNDEDRPSIWATLSNTTQYWLFGYLALYIVQLYCRALRYKWLLASAGETQLPTLNQMAIVTGIRNMLIDMLPARIGELSYIGLLNRGYGVKLEHGTSSLGIAMVFDFVALFLIVTLIVLKQLTTHDAETWALNSLLIVAAISMTGLYLCFYTGPKILALASSNRVITQNKTKKSRWHAFLLFANQLANSIVRVRNSGKLFAITGLSFVIRLLKYTGLYILFMAVTTPSFPLLTELPVEKVVSALIGGEMGASLPIPTFLSFGAYEAGSSLVFRLLEVADETAAFIVMLCVHIWSQLIDYLIGGILLVIFISLTSNRNPKESV